VAHDDSINQIKVFNAAGIAASASNDNTVRIWNLSTMSLLLTYNGHIDDVQCVEFIDGNTIASGSVDMSLQIWQVKDGKMLKKIKFTTWVTSILLLQSGLLASGDYLGKIRMWNVTTGNNVFSLANPQAGAIRSMITVGNAQMASGASDYKGYFLILLFEMYLIVKLTEIKLKG
jgi:WD40 repeat protein